MNLDDDISVVAKQLSDNVNADHEGHTFVCSLIELVCVASYAGAHGSVLVCKNHAGHVFHLEDALITDSRALFRLLRENGATPVNSKQNYMLLQLYFNGLIANAPRAIRHDDYGWDNPSRPKFFGGLSGYIKKGVTGQYFFGEGFMDEAPPVSIRALKKWQDTIAQPCLRNVVGAIAMGATFAAPLLRLMGAREGFGVHLYGTTSTGKSTIARMCSSVFGEPRSMYTWDATKASMARHCVEANDSAVVFDDFSAITDATKVLEITYSIPAGQERGRCTIDGKNRATRSWVCVLITTAEESIPQFMQRHKVKVQAGQMVRVLNMSTQEFDGQAFNALLGHKSSCDLVRAVHHSLQDDDIYGVAGRAFIHNLLNHPVELRTQFEAVKRQFREWLCTGATNPQGERVLDILDKCFFALWLAHYHGVIGVPLETILTGQLRDYLRSFLRRFFEAGGFESEVFLDKAINLMQENALSRFADVNEIQRTVSVWGFYDEDRLYMFPASFRKEMSRIGDPETIARLLHSRGFVHTPIAKPVRLNSRYVSRFYVFEKKALFGGVV